LILLVSPVAARIGLGSPGVDDATTLWQGAWEARFGVEAGAGYRHRGADIDLVRVPFSLRWGWRERLELGFELPFAYQRSRVQLFDGSGLSDFAIGLKYQMTRSEGNYPATSTEFRVGYGPDEPTGSGTTSFGLIYSLTKTFQEGRSAGHLNLGYTFFSAALEDVLSWGAAYERRFGELSRWSIGVNSGAQMLPGLRKNVLAELGLARELSPLMEVSLAGGIGVSKASPDWQMRLALTREFGSSAGAATPYRQAEWGAPPAPGAPQIMRMAELAASRGEYEEAILLYREAIEKDPELASAWNNLGIALFRRARFREAVDAYEKAAKIDPQNADIYFNMGLAHYKLGDFMTARRSFARALELNPDHATARSNLLSLEGREGVR
jgi:tetratricopeptide (TPR) repeat protein